MHYQVIIIQCIIKLSIYNALSSYQYTMHYKVINIQCIIKLSIYNALSSYKGTACTLAPCANPGATDRKQHDNKN